jgi:hypothetical protein
MSDLSSDSLANHERFVREVLETGLVWGLKSDQGWAVCESGEYPGTDVYPLWSRESDARRHCTDEWSAYTPASLDLDVFIDTWLAGMIEDGVLVGTNWDDELSGMEVDPDELAAELTEGDSDDDEDDS